MKRGEKIIGAIKFSLALVLLLASFLANAGMLLDRHDSNSKKQRDFHAPAAGGEDTILLSGGEIRINNGLVKLGAPMLVWKKALRGHPVCIGHTYIWKQLGIQVKTDGDHNRVFAIEIFLRLPEQDTLSDLITQRPDGTPIKHDLPKLPDVAFHGLLELDGVPIDSRTRFSDIRKKISAERQLRCGLLECEFPRGVFSDNAEIQLMLEGPGVTGRIVKLQIVQQNTE